ncbi:MAG: hypothetical protein LBJ94_00405 [Puniceicoccales bacterium]|jgi:hypothetical protein|nr:hypothetical protein [Puniceicoccales bacterium]
MAWIFVVVSLIGSVYNAMMYIKLSYALWLGSNIFLLAHNIRIREYSQAFLFGAYLIISIVGLKNSMRDGWFDSRR